MTNKLTANDPNPKNIYMHTLGCAKNTVQSQIMAGRLRQAGYTMVSQAWEADLIVINSCGFITAAKEESIAAILDALGLKQETQLQHVVVVGCMVQKYAAELEESLPEVDLWVGTSCLDDLVDALQTLENPSEKRLVGSSWNLADPQAYQDRQLDLDIPYAYLTLAEGCDNACSFCAIPDMTGPYRSRPREDIVAEAQSLVAQGVKEIILIAQDTTYYGKDLYGDFALASLLRDLNQIEGLQWIRLLYAYPNNFTDDLIAAMATSEKVCHYLDMPLQHADDAILGAMGRKITQAEIEALIQKLRDQMPDIVLRSTFIVGFPGESPDAFSRLLAFLERNQLDRVGVFPYSQEEGTPAGKRRDQVPEDIRQDRAQAFMEVQSQIMIAGHRQRLGQTIQVLVEEASQDEPGLYYCRSYGEAPEVDPLILVKAEPNQDLKAGDFVWVQLTDLVGYDLLGDIIHEPA